MSRLSRRKIRLFFAIVTIALTLFIAYQSTRPAGDPTVPVLKSWLSYAGHFGVYGAMAFSAMMAVARFELRAAASVVLACSLFGLGLEVYQGSADGRESTPMDAVSNLLGALVWTFIGFWGLVWMHLLVVDKPYAFTCDMIDST